MCLSIYNHNKLKIVPLELSSNVLLTLSFFAGGCCLTRVCVSVSSSASFLGLIRANTKLFPFAPVPTASSFLLLNCAIFPSEDSPLEIKEPRMGFPKFCKGCSGPCLEIGDLKTFSLGPLELSSTAGEEFPFEVIFWRVLSANLKN